MNTSESQFPISHVKVLPTIKEDMLHTGDSWSGDGPNEHSTSTKRSRVSTERKNSEYGPDYFTATSTNQTSNGVPGTTGNATSGFATANGTTANTARNKAHNKAEQNRLNKVGAPASSGKDWGARGKKIVKIDSK